MKLINAKILPISMISVATIGVAFVSGMTLTSYQTTKPPVHLFKATSSTTSAVIPTPATTADQSQPARDNSPSPVGAQMHTRATPAPTTRPTNTPTASNQQNAQTTVPAPAVTALGATLGDWTAPVSYSPSPFKEVNTTTGEVTVFPATVSYRYCVYAYSDGSTRRVTVWEQLAEVPGYNPSMGLTPNQIGPDCALANAPAIN
jgi:hypothetical protein